jgi:hypothetical protein
VLCLAAIWRLFAFIETAHRCRSMLPPRGLASHKPPPSSLLHGQAQSCWRKNLSPLVRRHLTLHRSSVRALKSRNAMIRRQQFGTRGKFDWKTQGLTSNASIYTSIIYNPLVLLLFRFQKPEKQP